MVSACSAFARAALIGLALSVSAAEAADEWTGENIVDETLTGGDIQDGSLTSEDLGILQSGVVRVIGPAVHGVQAGHVITMKGLHFTATCRNRDAFGEVRREARLFLTSTNQPLAIYGAVNGTLRPPLTTGRRVALMTSTRGGETMDGETRTLVVLSPTLSLTLTMSAAINLDGTNDCFFSVSE